MGYQIEKSGRLTLENGVLVARFDNGNEIGRIFVGRNGITIQGEVTCWQDGDPPKIRMASSYAPSWRGGLGVLSFNVLESDGTQREVAWFRGSLAEDATTEGDLRGQVDCYVRGHGQDEPTVAWIVSDAYTLAEYGIAKMRTYFREHVATLWKF